jgi:hypothetical protein
MLRSVPHTPPPSMGFPFWCSNVPEENQAATADLQPARSDVLRLASTTCVLMPDLTDEESRQHGFRHLHADRFLTTTCARRNTGPIPICEVLITRSKDTML